MGPALELPRRLGVVPKLGVPEVLARQVLVRDGVLGLGRLGQVLLQRGQRKGAQALLGRELRLLLLLLFFLVLCVGRPGRRRLLLFLWTSRHGVRLG